MDVFNNHAYFRLTHLIKRHMPVRTRAQLRGLLAAREVTRGQARRLTRGERERMQALHARAQPHMHARYNELWGATREERAARMWAEQGDDVRWASAAHQFVNVPSQRLGRARTYRVHIDDDEEPDGCTCPDFIHRGATCKHEIVAEKFLALRL